jgi:hypothetical protein
VLSLRLYRGKTSRPGPRTSAGRVFSARSITLQLPMSTAATARISAHTRCRWLYLVMPHRFSPRSTLMGQVSLAPSAGVVPVKFTLTQGGVTTCDLPPATIAVARTGCGVTGEVNESVYSINADAGSDFRIDNCQYAYNLNSRALGIGIYRVDILINGQVVGSATFELRQGTSHQKPAFGRRGDVRCSEHE